MVFDDIVISALFNYVWVVWNIFCLEYYVLYCDHADRMSLHAIENYEFVNKKD
jgi:hypothetical protein